MGSSRTLRKRAHFKKRREEKIEEAALAIRNAKRMKEIEVERAEWKRVEKLLAENKQALDKDDFQIYTHEMMRIVKHRALLELNRQLYGDGST